MIFAGSSDERENILMNCSINEDKKIKELSQFQRQLCNIQGKMFENSAKKHFKSESFIDSFMNSETARFFDLPYDRTQWLGEENLLQDLIDEKSLETGDLYSNESLFWIGYIYRYWHFLTGESSEEISRKCNAKMMNAIYPAYHTLDCKMAIERIIESEGYKSKGLIKNEHSINN